MVKTDIHFFSPDALPLVLQCLKDNGFKVISYKAVAHHDVRATESLSPNGAVTLKVKYDA